MRFLALWISILLFLGFSVKAQYTIRSGNSIEKISLWPYSSLIDVGHQNIDPKKVPGIFKEAKPIIINGDYGNLGFTDHTYWIKFSIENSSLEPLRYYLEVAEPMTDNLNLYLWGDHGPVEEQRNGDNLPFKNKSFLYRKPIFPIRLNPKETKTGYLEIRNDGETNNLPLNLFSETELLNNIINDQILIGIFYGVILIIFITYSFFFFALKEISFLYYSLYVLFAGLCHFALDGLFHQYFTPQNSWLNLNAVLLMALPASYFFGKYSEIILDVKSISPIIHQVFKVLYALMGMTFLGILLFHSFLDYAYPIVNILTLMGIVLISFSIIISLVKRMPLDRFYMVAIFILFSTFAYVILLNFGIIRPTLSLDHITKLTIGLEIIALSISMAQRIQVLKSNKEEMQALALTKAEEMNEIKSHFISNMSHELRTPLNAILGITQILEKETKDATMKSNLDIIRQSSFHLISSVNDILDFSLMESGELKLQQVEFMPEEVFDKVNRIYKSQAENKGLEYIFSCSLKKGTKVLGDPIRLEQILQNLISNSVKFTFKGAVVFRVEAKNDLESPLHLKMKISDTGVGISKSKLNGIFQMFSQVDIRNKRKFGGFGIGLCVSKALVDLQKGSFDIESKQNLGTVCTLSLPYPVLGLETGSQPAIEAIPNDFNLMGKNILVVEDNPMNQMVLKMMFKKWKNVNAFYAGDGKEGVETWKTRELDLILMDLQMPVMDGYEAIETIRKGKEEEALKAKSCIPILVVTADSTEDAQTRSIELGANDFMNKPLDQEKLYKKMHTLLFPCYTKIPDINLKDFISEKVNFS